MTCVFKHTIHVCDVNYRVLLVAQDCKEKSETEDSQEVLARMVNQEFMDEQDHRGLRETLEMKAQL